MSLEGFDKKYFDPQYEELAQTNQWKLPFNSEAHVCTAAKENSREVPIMLVCK